MAKVILTLDEINLLRYSGKT